MAVFEDVILEWDGEQKTVPPSRVMQLIAKVEDHITLAEIEKFMQRETVPFGRVAMAYAAALRHAGFNVTSDGVYKRLLSSAKGDEGMLALEVVQSLQLMMVPPEDLDVKKNPEEPGKPKAAKGS